MNLKDEIWFFTMKAIVAQAEDPYVYYYNKTDDCVFAAQFQGKEISVMVRNKHVSNYELIMNTITSYLNQESTIKLKRLSLSEKKELLIGAIEQQNDLELLEKIKPEIDSLSDNDRFGFKTDLKKSAPNLFFKIDSSLGLLWTKKIIQLYFPHGLSENTRVIW